MRITTKWLLATAMAAGIGATPGLAIQQEEPAPVEEAAPVETAPEPIRGLELQGTLKAVDPDAQIFLVTSASGEELLFHYDDQTEVVGQGEGIQGLSAGEASMWNIEYRAEGTRAIAERLEPTAAAPAGEAEPEAPASEDPGQ